MDCLLNDHIRRAGHFLQDAVGEGFRETFHNSQDAAHQEGFFRAAEATMQLIDHALEGFTDAMVNMGLSKSEQATYVRLLQLKTDIEASYDRYWSGTGLDWRLQHPAAKAVIPRNRSNS